MQNKMINVDDIKLAKIKYYDSELNGVELSDISAYVVLIKCNGKYINVFDPELRDVPVLRRTVYVNVTKDGDDYGTKLVYVCGELKSGMCYIIEDKNMREVFKKDNVNISDIEKYIINSIHFFVDRENIVLNSHISYRVRKNVKLTLLRDHESKEKLNKYFSERNIGIQYFK